MIHVPNGMGLRFVALVIVAAGLAHPAEPQEWARPYPPCLPGFEPVDAAGERTCVSVRLLHRTDEGLVAVTGGRVSFWTEDGDLSTLASSLLAEAASDEFGFANLPRPGNATSGDHWIFTAPGLGASHEFAAFDGYDDSEVVLPGGVDRRIRVLDPLGAPLAGGDVSMYLGCPHSPSVCTGTTGEDGVVVLENLPADRREYFWVVAPGVRPGPYDLLPPAEGETCDRILADPGRTLRGTVEDEKGAPMPDVVVRKTGYGRGPVAVTDADGRFAVHGIDGSKAPIGFFVPGTAFADRPALLVREFAEDVPLRVVLRRDRPVFLAEGEPRQAVDIRTVRREVFEDGGGTHECFPEEDRVPVTLTRLSDGLTVAGITGEARTEGSLGGVLRVEVPTGTYRITAGGGFSAYEAGSATAVLPPPDAAPVEVRLGAKQPYLVGGVAGDCAEVRIPGSSRLLAGQALQLPADVPATVLSGSGDRLIPVGPLDTSGFDPVRRILDGPPVPPPGAEEVQVPLTRRVVRLLKADGTPLSQEECPGVAILDAPDGAGAYYPGEFVEADEDGTVNVECGPRGVVLEAYAHHYDPPLLFYPLSVRITPAGPAEIRLPAGRISGQARDPDGRPVEAVVYIDAHRFEAAGGGFDVRGIRAGPHIVIAGAPGRVGEARRVVLAEGETRVLDFVLPLR